MTEDIYLTRDEQKAFDRALRRSVRKRTKARMSIIEAAVKHVAAWPQWKRDMFEAFSKRNSE